MQADVSKEKVTPDNRHNKIAVRLILIIVATIVVIAISSLVYVKISRDLENANSIHFSYVSKEFVDSITEPENNIQGIEDIGSVEEIIYSEDKQSEILVSMKIKDIPDSGLKNISSEFFKQHLSDKEKTVYNSIMFAYQNGYNYIGFSDRKFDAQMLSKATFYIMCDNPYIEINLERSIISRNGYVYLFFPNMTPDKKEYNDLAYEEAVKIIAGVSDELETEYAVAKYLYEYLVCNTNYTQDTEYDSSVEPALYHALTGQMTNCDGFANALTILYNMAGIECFNVFYPGDDLGPGHTWCIANLDSEYYHLDPSNDASVYQVIQTTDSFSFLCASDQVKMANSYYHESISELVPKCTDTQYDYANVDIHIDATDVDTAFNDAVNYITELGLEEDMTDREYFLVNFNLLNGMEDGVRDTFIRGLVMRIEEKYVVEGYAYIGAGTVFILLSV